MTTRSTQGSQKPKKPRANFPLFAHGAGQWAAKVNGKLRYFGVWADPDAALAKYKDQFPYLQIGIEPPQNAMTVATMLNYFPDHKVKDLEAGRIKARSLAEYTGVSDVVADVLGKSRSVDSITPIDLRRIADKFAIGKHGQRVSPITQKRLLTFARMIFRYSNTYLGTNFKYEEPLASPTKQLIRQRRKAIGPKMYAATELRLMLSKADATTKAVILLGINAGLGPTDCIELKHSHIRNGILDFPRPKTGISRSCPLWEETQQAIDAIADGGEYVLGPKTGQRGRVRQKWNRHMLARDLRKLCEECNIYREGITTQYSMRRTFETIAKCSGVNQSTIDQIMGHENSAISETYNQKTFISQQRNCVDFVRSWMLGVITID